LHVCRSIDQHVNMVVLLHDQPCIGQYVFLIRHITRKSKSPPTCGLDTSYRLLGPVSDNVADTYDCTFLGEQLRGSQADTRCTTCNHNDLILETHCPNSLLLVSCLGQYTNGDVFDL